MTYTFSQKGLSSLNVERKMQRGLGGPLPMKKTLEYFALFWIDTLDLLHLEASFTSKMNKMFPGPEGRKEKQKNQ